VPCRDPPGPLARQPVPPGPVTLVVEIGTASPLPPTATSSREPASGIRPGGPDTIVFSIGTEHAGRSADGSAGVGGDSTGEAERGEPLAELDGRHLSTQVAGGFTGRVIGMYVTEGGAPFDRFAYTPSGA
jgi:hypothetical protein